MIVNELIARYQQQHLTYALSDIYPGLSGLNLTSSIIWSGASDQTIYPVPQFNWLFRAHHDALHLAHKMGFTLAEEIELTKRGIAQLHLDTQPDVARLYWLDNVGQQLHYYRHGQFPVDQQAFIISAWNDPFYINLL